ncbi:hypothetical protein ACOSQ4_031843 [Xanthoceras sorbifolium]
MLLLQGKELGLHLTNFVPNDGDDRSYHERISKIDRIDVLKDNLNSDFNHIDGLENIEVTLGSPTPVNPTEDNISKKRKIFRAKDINDDTSCSIAEAIELLCRNSEIPRKNKLYMLATKRFLRKQNKEIFIALKDDSEVQIEWLKEMNK